MTPRTRHALWGIVIGVAAAAIFAVLDVTGLLHALEYKTYDLRMMATRHAAKGSGENVALLYVDQPSLDTMKEMGITWPWPRELYAGALEFARRGGAKAVLFDLFFSEDSSYGVADDEGFAKGIAAGPPSYFVYFASKDEGEAKGTAARILEQAHMPFGAKPQPFLQEVRSLKSAPIPVIAEHAAGFGNAQVAPDADGIFRRLPLAVRLDDSILPLAAAEVAGNVAHFGSIDWKSPTDLKIDGRRVPLDDDGNLMINYIGGVDSYPVYPLAQVLISNQQISEGKKPDLDPAVLKDRIIIIGVAAPGLYDLKPTPLAKVYPGPEVHATVIDSLLRHSFITPLHAGARVVIILLMALGAALGLSQVSRLSHIIAWIAGIACAYIALAFCSFWKGMWIPLAAPIAALALSSFAVILRNYMTEGKRRRAIKRAFGQYLSPAVVGEIAKDPDNVRMGGEEREVTVFFSDIANFTSISEGMSPTELVSRLCRYLTEVTGIITGHEGTLDKYIGDAVMAFWGAPLPIKDHAAHAVLSAIEVQKALEAMPEFQTRIGIHTGNAVVGNVGSDLRFNYTAIGDTVNLASRLEGLNKKFGTRIIVSEATYREAQDAVEARLIGRVRVKGRSEPIAIYEPLAAKGGLDPAALDELAKFGAAMQRFNSADFGRAKAAFEELGGKGDSVVAYYLSVCDKYASNPPENFDGVITFTEK
ncbi:MAG: adenylate/guanylate cyclase domain-containing protein [bacterium]